ncbi:MAG: Gfo/Idh/MocA family oxidoreductase [Clostridia bacterium]|nr:Gfo/Idh/MocA family oxidoreductase [Clostridia bacterium]
MEDKIFNIAVIGSAGMARRHMKGVIANPKARLYAVCDIHPEQIEKAKALPGADIAVTTTDYRTLLDDPKIDAAIIVTPDQTHVEITCAFLRAGKHVMCEKPMALSIAECEEMMRVEKETGKMLMIGQVCRCNPTCKVMKKMVDDGMIGDLYFVESEYAHSYTIHPGVDNWRITPERNGFIGGGCHAVDLLRWIAGNPTEVSAYSNHKCLTDWPADDCTVSIMKFPNGVIGKVFASIGCVRDYTMRTVLYGTKGTIIKEREGLLKLYKGDGKKINGNLDFTYPIEIPVESKSHNVAGELEIFLDALINGKKSPITSLDGASTVAVCNAAIESAKTGKPVQIKYPEM